MADKYQAGVTLDRFRPQLQVKLRDNIDFEASRQGPFHKMGSVRRPTGGSIFFTVTVGIGPIHVWIGNRLIVTGTRCQRRARRVAGQYDETSW